jgi:hypothetical protein
VGAIAGAAGSSPTGAVAVDASASGDGFGSAGTVIHRGGAAGPTAAASAGGTGSSTPATSSSAMRSSPAAPDGRSPLGTAAAPVAGAAGCQARHATPTTAMVIPRPISAHHSQTPAAPAAPAAPSARWSAPVVRMRCHVAASPGSTSTTGGPGSSAAKAQGAGASAKGRQPSAENGSWTPLMA